MLCATRVVCNDKVAAAHARHLPASAARQRAKEQDVEDLMAKGNACFAAHDFDGALRCVRGPATSFLDLGNASYFSWPRGVCR